MSWWWHTKYQQVGVKWLAIKYVLYWIYIDTVLNAFSACQKKKKKKERLGRKVALAKFAVSIAISISVKDTPRALFNITADTS